MRSHSADGTVHEPVLALTRSRAGSSIAQVQSPHTVREEALLRQMPFVCRMARHMRKRLPSWVEVDDLVSAGTVGLMEALAKFDPERNVDFEMYARSRIRGAMLDSLRALDWGPRPLRRMGRTVDEAVCALTARLRREPDDSEIAAEIGIGLDEYHKLKAELHGLDIETLHAERNPGSGEEAIESVPSGPEGDSLLQCMQGEQRERLAAIIDSLPDRERLVITLYYYEEMSLREIALTLGVGQSRASQIHASAVAHLRAMLDGSARPRSCKGRRRGPAARCRESLAAA